jgi:lysozyme family protein
MATTSFAHCKRTALVFEGGKVNSPNDPRGRTNEAVIQRVYDGWRRRGAAVQRAAVICLRQLGIAY